MGAGRDDDKGWDRGRRGRGHEDHGRVVTAPAEGVLSREGHLRWLGVPRQGRER